MNHNLDPRPQSRGRAVFAVLVLSCLVALLPPPAAAQAGKTLRVGLFPAAPLVFSENGRPSGLFVDVLEYCAKALGWNLVYVDDSWGNLLGRLERGEIDILPAVGFTTARAAIYDFTKNPVYIDSGVVFTGRSFTIHTVFDLQGRNIAGVRGSLFTTEFTKYADSFGIKCQMVLVEDNPAVMEAIVTGRADAGVCIYSLGNELAKRYSVRITPVSFSPIALHFAVPKGDPAGAAAAIDGIFAAMPAGGDSYFDRAFRKWISPESRARVSLWLWLCLIGLCLAGLLLLLLNRMLNRQVELRTQALRKEVAERVAAGEELRKLVAEKDTLLRELYHRTKNTLQVIRSMIMLQAEDYPDDPIVLDFARIVDGKIEPIFLVHRMLYQSQDLSRISSSDYLRDLAETILQTRSDQNLAVTLGRDGLEEHMLLIDTAIPLGLVLNELMTNSLRHAFSGRGEGRIDIAFSRLDSGEYRLRYADDGIGVPEGFDFRGQATMGLKLIFAIGEGQLMGRVEFAGGSGLACELTIPDGLFRARV